MTRYAIVTGARSGKEVAAYLPDNYEVIGEYAVDDPTPSRNEGPDTRPNHWIIRGVDVAGWTLADYVTPRLWSGLMGCREVGVDDPAVQRALYDERTARLYYQDAKP